MNWLARSPAGTPKAIRKIAQQSKPEGDAADQGRGRQPAWHRQSRRQDKSIGQNGHSGTFQDQPAELGAIGLLDRNGGGKPPMGQNRDAAGERQNLIEVFADHQHADATRGGRKQPVLHSRRRPHIQAARRGMNHQDGKFALEFPRQDEFLGIAAREQPRLGIGYTARDLITP